jgi:hypothetical protein
LGAHQFDLIRGAIWDSMVTNLSGCGYERGGRGVDRLAVFALTASTVVLLEADVIFEAEEAGTGD